MSGSGYNTHLKAKIAVRKERMFDMVFDMEYPFWVCLLFQPTFTKVLTLFFFTNSNSQ